MTILSPQDLNPQPNDKPKNPAIPGVACEAEVSLLSPFAFALAILTPSYLHHKTETQRQARFPAISGAILKFSNLNPQPSTLNRKLSTLIPNPPPPAIPGAACKVLVCLLSPFAFALAILKPQDPRQNSETQPKPRLSAISGVACKVLVLLLSPFAFALAILTRSASHTSPPPLARLLEGS